MMKIFIIFLAFIAIVATAPRKKREGCKIADADDCWQHLAVIMVGGDDICDDLRVGTECLAAKFEECVGSTEDLGNMGDIVEGFKEIVQNECGDERKKRDDVSEVIENLETSFNINEDDKDIDIDDDIIEDIFDYDEDAESVIVSANFREKRGNKCGPNEADVCFRKLAPLMSPGNEGKCDQISEGYSCLLEKVMNCAETKEDMEFVEPHLQEIRSAIDEKCGKSLRRRDTDDNSSKKS